MKEARTHKNGLNGPAADCHQGADSHRGSRRSQGQWRRPTGAGRFWRWNGGTWMPAAAWCRIFESIWIARICAMNPDLRYHPRIGCRWSTAEAFLDCSCQHDFLIQSATLHVQVSGAMAEMLLPPNLLSEDGQSVSEPFGYVLYVLCSLQRRHASPCTGFRWRSGEHRRRWLSEGQTQRVHFKLPKDGSRGKTQKKCLGSS